MTRHEHIDQAAAIAETQSPDYVDRATYEATYERGRVIVRHEVGEIVASFDSAEPFGAASDSWALAQECAAAMAAPKPVRWVEHDGATIFFGFVGAS